MHNKQLTVVTPIIRDDLVERMLETLYEYTDPIFYVIIIDQTVEGLDATRLRNTYKNLMIVRTPKSDMHYTGNLGFAQATNLGISLVQTPYFMMCNDDVEFIHPKWWEGVMETFALVGKSTPSSPAVIVNPSSVKLPDWSVGRPKGDDHYILPYKDQYTDADWDYLINKPHFVNKHLTLQPGSVIDGVTMYASVCDTRRFLEIGMLDEKFFPGSGEDYDYSCRARMFNYRCVGTTLSYVYHHWSSTFKALQDQAQVQSLQMPELNWNHTNEKWGDDFDIWGVHCPTCKEIMVTKDGLVAQCPNHPEQSYRMPESVIQPL